MAITHTVTKTWDNGGVALSKSESVSAGAESSVSESVADASTDLLIAFELDVSQAKVIFILSTTALTLETNSGSTPTDTITLAANVPLLWTTNDGSANPFSGDITALYATNSSGSAATLDIRVLHDPTV
jgi:hypothetical protein